MAGITERPGLLAMLPSSHGQGSHTLGDTETRWCHCMRIRSESPDCALWGTQVCCTIPSTSESPSRPVTGPSHPPAEASPCLPSYGVMWA